MVKIRLMRVGKKKQPSYRVVVADSRSPRDGRIIEAIGHYHPRQEPSEISIDGDRAVHWLQRGAQPSGQVRKLLQISGAWAAFTGEAPPAGTAAGAPAAKTKKPKATPAASVSEPAPDEAEDAATLPEAVDQSGAAPEADTTGDDDAAVPEAAVSSEDEPNP
jgi:small subunit ribosomal protein S16